MIAMAKQKQHAHVAQAAGAALGRLAMIGLAVGAIAFLPVPAALAQSLQADAAHTSQPVKISREYLIKAAILYNFAKFAEWPKTAFRDDKSPLRICVIGDDPFGPALNSLQGKTVRNRELAAGHITKVEDAAACHILFVSASESERLDTILAKVGALPILTVADINRFAYSGGIIALKEVDKRSRIEVNLGAADQAGLKLSSKLLRLADTVGTQTAQTRQAPK